MRLSNKHANVQAVDYQDFTGGLNVEKAIETIELNELNRCVNFELNGSQLAAVSGTTALKTDDTIEFTDMFYDRINNLIILCGLEPDDEDETVQHHFVYTIKTDGTSLTKLDELTGNITPCFASWEDGVLIASGGKLQYWNGTTLTTINTSPTHCNGVYVSHGRVIVYYDDILHYSAVGDETNWTEDDNDDSASKWLQVGYKDGGQIVSVISLSQDILAFKSTHSAYHVAGQFPGWQVREISRNVDTKSWRSAISLTNSAIVLGRSMLQALAPTDDYGEMHSTNIAQKIVSYIQALPSEIKLRFVAPLNQVWFMTGNRKFLFLDVTHQSFFMREYNRDTVDVCTKGDTVFVLKKHELCYLDNDPSMLDSNEPLRWEMYGKTLVSNNDYLVKRARADITPLFQTYANVNFFVGHIRLSDLVPKEAQQIYHDYTYIYHSRRPIKSQPINAVYINSDEIYENDYEIYNNETYIKSMAYVRRDRRQIDRHPAIKVYGKGSGGRFILNRINFEIVEV